MNCLSSSDTSTYWNIVLGGKLLFTSIHTVSLVHCSTVTRMLEGTTTPGRGSEISVVFFSGSHIFSCDWNTATLISTSLPNRLLTNHHSCASTAASVLSLVDLFFDDCWWLCSIIGFKFWFCKATTSSCIDVNICMTTGACSACS